MGARGRDYFVGGVQDGSPKVNVVDGRLPGVTRHVGEVGGLARG